MRAVQLQAADCDGGEVRDTWLAIGTIIAIQEHRPNVARIVCSGRTVFFCNQSPRGVIAAISEAVGSMFAADQWGSC